MAFPAWFAAIVQVRAAIPVTVVPEIVHTEEVVEVSVTARPEVTVAVTMPVAGRVILVGTVKVMVWPLRLPDALGGSG